MTDEPKLRVVIAEDSVLLREGVARILEEAGFEVVGQSSTAEDLLLKVRSYSPDVAIVDIRMPPSHTDEGLPAAKAIRAEHPDVGVLVLSQYVEPDYALELLADDAEGVGYLLKDRVADVGEFASAVRRVADGGSALDPRSSPSSSGRRRSDDPVDDADPTRARGARADGRRPLQPGDRAAPRRHRARRREARDEHLRQARPAGSAAGSPPRARRAGVPARVRWPRWRSKLKTTELGSTGMEITRVGFGAWAIGGGGFEWSWGAQEDEDSIAAIHRALELGVNWIDTAAQYGFGHSEEVVGRAIAGARRAAVRLHQGRAARGARRRDAPRPDARRAQARARRKPRAPGPRGRRPLPDPLADPRRADRGRLGGARRAPRRGAHPPHRRLQLQRRAAAPVQADRAGRDAPAAVLADRTRGRGRDPALRRARRASA